MMWRQACHYQLAMQAKRARMMPGVLDHMPLKMTPGKHTVAGVVIEARKVSAIARNGVIYDIFSMADEGCTNPSTKQHAMTVKVFHNDGTHYLHGNSPRRGDVLVLKDMRMDRYDDKVEYIMYSTQFVFISRRLYGQPYWSTTSLRRPKNIIGADDAVKRLFRWWEEEGEEFVFTPRPSYLSFYPCLKLAEIDPESVTKFTLTCKILSKKDFGLSSSPVGILEVCDGTKTPHSFAWYRPDNPMLLVRRKESLLADIFLYYSIILEAFHTLKIGDYVKLYGVECVHDSNVVKTLFLAVGEKSFKVLTREDNETEIESIEERMVTDD